MIQAIGIDFGTTNSVVALLHDDGSVTTQRHADGDVFRSVLCFWTEDTAARRVAPPRRRPRGDLRLPRGSAGQPADHVDEDLPGAEELLRDPHLRPPLHPGTPDRLLPPRPPRRHPAGRRASSSAARCASPASSWTTRWAPTACAAPTPRPASPQVTLALEPEAAGTRFARTLTEPATVLIGDFGGGTSDFSVMRFDPRARQHAARPRRHRHRRRRVRLPHHRPRHRAAARQGRHLPRHGQAAAGAARVLLRLRPLAPAVADAHAAHAARHRRGGTHRAASRAPAPPDRADRGRARLCAVSGRLHRQGGAVAAPRPPTLRFRHKDFAVERTDHARRVRRLDRAATSPASPPRSIRCWPRPALPADAGGSRVPHRRHRLRPRRPPPVRRPLRRRQKLAGGGEFVSVAEGLALIGQPA